MSQTWIGKARSLSLWAHINNYVDAYTTIHQTPPDEPWFQRWKELINIHNITKKKRDFEFIAYVITGNPEATVFECIQHIFSFIPELDKHINITSTNTNGNIQYTYTEPSEDTSNRFAAFMTDDTSDNQAEKDLESILDSETSDNKKPSPNPTNVFDNAMNTATSTLKKLSDLKNMLVQIFLLRLLKISMKNAKNQSTHTRICFVLQSITFQMIMNAQSAVFKMNILILSATNVIHIITHNLNV